MIIPLCCKKVTTKSSAKFSNCRTRTRVSDEPAPRGRRRPVQCRKRAQRRGRAMRPVLGDACTAPAQQRHGPHCDGPEGPGAGAVSGASRQARRSRRTCGPARALPRGRESRRASRSNPRDEGPVRPESSLMRTRPSVSTHSSFSVYDTRHAPGTAAPDAGEEPPGRVGEEVAHVLRRRLAAGREACRVEVERLFVARRIRRS